MDKRLLSILCCPATHKGLSLLKKDRLEQVNAAIDAGELVNHDGHRPDARLSEALITDDGKRIYPVREGIPVLLEGEAINTEQLA